MKEFHESTLRILAAIKAVPKGRVSSYRNIALAAGLPNGARQVARILHSLAEKEKLPWHRIIKADGRIALGEGNGRELQISLLRSEGVRVSKAGVVDMGCYGIQYSL
ncbi:MGMT family protein [Treponema primitia]|uniref:MGMT family protein n=1 Tax=Treponema primitia TaxID=88058 RepID=UPI000255578E|nr:MGMT family protein [Treponema primitia]